MKVRQTRVGDSVLARRFRDNIEGEVLFDAFSRGRYSTDASIYQIEPIGVIVPRTENDVVATLEIAAEEDVPVLPRGGGTSQCGQTVGEAVVIDVSKHLNELIHLDTQRRLAEVQPGIVLDHLNAALKPHRLMFPVDVSTASRATLGGMTGNNSCGARSIRYGTMRDNVAAVDAWLADGEEMRFGALPADLHGVNASARQHDLMNGLLALGRREAVEIQTRFPDLQRRVGGYNIDALIAADSEPVNLAHLLVGSEGTLAVSKRIQLKLQHIPAVKVLGVCHFPSFFEAMDVTQHIVKLDPSAVELVDRTMIELAREIPMFRATVEKFVSSNPDALLLVEFAGEEQAEQLAKLKRLTELLADLGFADAVVDAIEPDFQQAIWEVRKAGLNIMMSMKGDGKPISFIEDCAVRLEDLAEYTDRLKKVFHKHGTTGTWYAHASVGCLHVRPVINLKAESGAQQMRAIAEEAFAMVREYKGSHSGEHGDGLVRSEFHRPMFGERMIHNFEEIKKHFDPRGMLNPGKIVNPPAMDDRTLFRYKPDYEVIALKPALDWSEWGGFGAAVEMCNNNGHCRKTGGVMCPSYQATGDEQHVTRGRANSLRLALSGQLGPDALTSDEMRETMKLCVGCKGCRRECPTGVDMARMKTEFLYHYYKRHGLTLHDRLVAYLPRYARAASRLRALANLRDRVPGLSSMSESMFGFSARRTLPVWQRDTFAKLEPERGRKGGREVVLLADTFNRYFEPENLCAALRVLEAAGYCIHLPRPVRGHRPLCCGRTFLAAGLVDQARAEARRTIAALQRFVEKDIPVIGLEPSCLLTLRDEFRALLPGAQTDRLAGLAVLLEEFLATESDAGTLDLHLRSTGARNALLHGHCHQKAFGAMRATEKVIRLVPELETKVVDSSCCGMAGAFGYGADTYDVSMKMGEASLLPAVRGADEDTLIVADGTSCRHQIKDGTGRETLHVARVLEMALDRREPPRLSKISSDTHHQYS